MIGAVSGRQEVEIPLIAILNTLFSVIFGRRLGTIDDGTSLRANALESGKIDLDDNTIEHFGPNQRDVTLTRAGIDYDYLTRKRTKIDKQLVKQGHAYAGPRWGTLDKYATTIFANDIGYTFKTFNELKVFGTRTSLDGRSGIFLMSSDPNGKNVKMMTAFPSVVTYNQNDFSNTVVRWDDEGPLFDDTTP